MQIRSTTEKNQKWNNLPQEQQQQQQPTSGNDRSGINDSLFNLVHQRFLASGLFLAIIGIEVDVTHGVRHTQAWGERRRTFNMVALPTS